METKDVYYSVEWWGAKPLGASASLIGSGSTMRMKLCHLS